MNEIEFNLLDEPWIRVVDSKLNATELSLTDTLLQAHRFAGLNGELPTQDIAVLRLLLAILHTVFSRFDSNGIPSPLRSENDALIRWSKLWADGQFPEKTIRGYLYSWRDRFWLFHPERPFWQVPAAKIGTEYGAAKLNGTLSESSNKIRLFPSRTGDKKNALTYAEAARWLLYVNAFDDTSAKPKTKQGNEKMPSPGVGWLGKLGIIAAKGNNLFETLMLNLILRKDGMTSWGPESPIWEQEKPRTKERIEIPEPDNLSELYTLQSRRLLLIRENNYVTGYTLLGGDFFSPVNAFNEQMTIWRVNGGTGAKDRTQLIPARHDPSKQLWREFPEVFLGRSEHGHRPGVVSWIATLKNRRAGLNKQSSINFSTASVQYGDKDFFISDVVSDSISFHSDLLSDAGAVWQNNVSDEIGKCEMLANCVGSFASELAKASGKSGDLLTKKAVQQDRETAKKAREELYFRLDIPFRTWLASISPEDDISEKNADWHTTAYKIASSLGREMIDKAGTSAFCGKHIRLKENGVEVSKFYSSPQAYNRFLFRIKSVYY